MGVVSVNLLSMDNTRKRINRNNRARGKIYEKRSAELVNGWRNLDKSRPHTDVENNTHVYEIKSTQTTVPVWIRNAVAQGENASKESGKKFGGIIKVYTRGAKARFFLVQELTDNTDV